MAFRRAPPRAQTVASRPRSAMAKMSAPHPREEPPEVPSLASSVQTKSTKYNLQGDTETNIQVVIRCRRRSEREMEENSPIIVSSNGAKSQEVTIETSAPISSLGLITLPPTRTYPFDLVFGPEADQAMIYHEVVSPMLDEVLTGYNCTLFAYGQTGTGKTYTMQGDLTPTKMGNPSAQAGMIPRVLFRLFHQLETSATDYSVKISYVELYNEELRDLLANELASPSGNVQPMGKGTAADNVQGLKIYEESTKKGVYIQGLEETPVKDSADALALLTKGSQRRQIAATKFNDHSSRSHSIFSITVHIKETSAIGDDLLKVGKLNLVDLAGSENIGRSGAENKRAREAGMINQSLLTLGRVINALVDHSSHVPYRESKLTRLLQDSLGGRTKTCIIATISPSRSNMEETLSTLDYALRAKSIRNKPEVNQRMTRNSLLKEYVAEIERLKADVLAAREKNGIFFSEETWNQMTTEQELRQTQMEEAKKQVEIVESQLRNVREEFEQSIALLMKRDGELRDTREKLKDTERELEVKESQLTTVKGALEEEVTVRQAYQVNESVLDCVATGLKHVAGESISNIHGLFDKLERKTSVFTTNSKAVHHHGKTISAEALKLAVQLDEFIKTSGHNIQRLRAEAKQHQIKELEILSSHSERIDQQLKRMANSLHLIQTKDEASNEALVTMQNAVSEMQENMKASYSAWSDSLRASLGLITKEFNSSALGGLATIESTFEAMGNLIDSVIREAVEHARLENQSLVEAKAVADAMAKLEMTRLKEQNQHLTRMLEAEKVKSEKAKDDLVQRISGLLGDFVVARDQELREAFGGVVKQNKKAGEETSAISQRHDHVIQEASARANESNTLLGQRHVEGKRTRDGALKAVASMQGTLKDGLANIQSAASTSTTAYSAEMQRYSQGLSVTFSAGLERHGRVKRARIEGTKTMVNEAQSDLQHLQRGLASTSRNVESFVGRVVAESTSLSEELTKHHSVTSAHLISLQDTTRTLLEQGVRDDIPTGRTPRKRVWEYVDQWELTKDRETILKSCRQRDASLCNTVVPLAGHSPLLEDKENEADVVIKAPVEEASSPSPMTATDSEDISTPRSPLALSLVSSASSQSIPLEQLEPRRTTSSKTLPAKHGLPTIIPLAERPPNIVGNRASRRIR